MKDSARKWLLLAQKREQDSGLKAMISYQTLFQVFGRKTRR